jgi:hypothetical protein
MQKAVFLIRVRALDDVLLLSDHENGPEIGNSSVSIQLAPHREILAHDVAIKRLRVHRFTDLLQSGFAVLRMF